ncbi:FAD-dependent monooxygenase [Pseudonocardia benzenivorans]|uniref:FAD-dependent monooxygenase n=1 Tax=Pseudonocardia benzenivorans TaxID=228005 RepID=A0ABW3VIX4_9PSEU
MTTRTRSADCQVLVIGAGPAGLATAITAIRNGAGALVVERHPGTSIHPRATGVHLRTMELLRTWGLRREVRALDARVRPLRSVSPTLREATPVPMGYPTDPREVLAVSPVLPVCCPQDRLEPVLLDHLRALGGEVRFGVELVDLVDDRAGVTATLRDRATGAASVVRARFVVGADGTRSVVRRLSGIPLERLGEIGEFVLVHFAANLDDLLGEDRRFGMYVVTHPDAEVVVVRAGGDRWSLARQWFPERGESPADFTPDRCVELVRTAAGDPALDVRVLTHMPFTMVGELAATFRAGNAFVVGDAAHRMTPAGALGMNTAIQSAHNLGWKLAWVARGLAGEALLDTYHAERKPAGERNARRSLEMLEVPPTDGEWTVDLDRRYVSAVIAPTGSHLGGVLPGRRAPHAWASVAGRRRSLLDLFDGRLTLIVGPDADGWRAAAAASPVPVQVLGIGRELGCDAQRLARRYGVASGGAVLVRPDGHVAWTCARAAEPVGRLLAAVDLALGRAGGHALAASA